VVARWWLDSCTVTGVNAQTPAFVLIAALSLAACGGREPLSDAQSDGTAEVGTAATRANSRANSQQRAVNEADASGYSGPSVGAAKGFAALAYSAITSLASSAVTGNLGVSGASVQNIAGFDALPVSKFGIDSSPPNGSRAVLTQGEVDALVDDIDVRACDASYTGGAAELTHGMTLRPGVTCLSGSGAEFRLGGPITLDAAGDANAFFIIRSNVALTVADETVLLLANGAQACSVFWRVDQQITIGAKAALLGTLIAGTGITMQSGATLVGRALARQGAVVLDGNAITIPVYGTVGAERTCAHLQ